VGEARAWTICSQLNKRWESNTGGEERQLEAGRGREVQPRQLSKVRPYGEQRLLNAPLLIGGFDCVGAYFKLGHNGANEQTKGEEEVAPHHDFSLLRNLAWRLTPAG